MNNRSDGKVNKSEKDKNAAFQERFHTILDDLLKEEDNKYCVDCDAKGPRWASWNLGVFMCIRCAGIHRKMGVHIARVKSVNLDSWTAEQVAMMQEMGNSRGRAVYEANLSENFRRPQTNSGIEAFIFAKYVQKKYIAREWVPPKPNVEFVLKEPSYVRDREHNQAAVLAEAKKKTRNHSNSDAPQPQAAAAAAPHVPAPTNNKLAEVQKLSVTPAKQPPAVVDLISVDDLLSSDGGDFGAFEGYTSDASSGIGSLASSDIASLQMPSAASQLNPSMPLQTQHSASSDLAELQPNGQGQGQGQGASKKSKDDILKLYSGLTAAGTPAMMQPAGGMYGAQMPGGVPMQMYAQRPMTGGGMMPGAMMAPGYPGPMPYGGNQQQMMMMSNMQYPGHAQQVVPPSYANCVPGSAGNMQYQQQPQSGMQQFQQQQQPGMQQFQQPQQPGMSQFQLPSQTGLQQFQQQPQSGMQQFQQQPQSGMQQFQQQPGMQFQQPQQPGMQYQQAAQYQPYQQQQHINLNMMNQQMAGLSMNNSGTQSTTGALNGHGWP